MLAVRGYDKEESRRSACFRRWPGLRHDQGSQYDLHAQTKQIAEDSDELLVGGRAGWRLVSEQVLQRPKPRPGEPRPPRTELTFMRKTTQLQEFHYLPRGRCGGWCAACTPAARTCPSR